MIIPTTLKIGGHTFKVDQSKSLKELNGETDLGTCEIRICKDLVQSQKESTLIHEIFHAINTSIDEQPLGHALIDSFAEQFYQVLHDNKLLK